jgi:hypothetical protein
MNQDELQQAMAATLAGIEQINREIEGTYPTKEGVAVSATVAYRAVRELKIVS